MSIAVALLGTARDVKATEGGGSIYPNGVENYLVGAMPPPGIYPLVYGTFYTAGSVRDNDGNDVADPNLNVEAIVPRLIWVTPLEPAGLGLAVHAIVPVVNVNVGGPIDDSKFGLGDITIGAGLGRRKAPTFFVVGIDLNMPTGAYDVMDPVNVGRNYWNIEPLAIVTYAKPNGLNADLKVMYDFNFRNPDTNYLSGQELHADYDIGWGFLDSWAAGIGGYLYQQVTNDDDDGVTVEDFKGRSFAVGPSVVFNNHKGWFITAKYQFELGVRNRAEGSQLWLKTIIPL